VVVDEKIQRKIHHQKVVGLGQVLMIKSPRKKMTAIRIQAKNLRKRAPVVQQIQSQIKSLRKKITVALILLKGRKRGIPIQELSLVILQTI